MKIGKVKRLYMTWIWFLLLGLCLVRKDGISAKASEVSSTEQEVSATEHEISSGKEITQSTIEEIYRLWKENGMGNIKVDIDEIQNFKVSGNMQASIEDYKTEADVPIFMVLITDGESVVGTSAFYVRDTYGTGGTYLVTSALAKIFLDNGYGVIVVGQDYAEEVTKIHCPDETSLHAYIEVEGVKKYVPLEMANEIEYENCGLGFLEISDEEFNLDMDWFDLSGWQKNGEIFFSDEVEEGFTMLGAPAYTGDSMEVFGMFFKDEDHHLIIKNMIGLDFPEEAMIEQTEVKQEDVPVSGQQPQSEKPEDSEPEIEESETNEPSTQEETNGEQEQTGQQPVQNGNKAKDDNSVTIIAAIATFLILSFFISKNKKKGNGGGKKESAGKLQSDYREGTIEMKEEMQIPPTVNIAANPTMPEWQLRGLSGTFEGQTFLLEHHLIIGRNLAGQIVYPQNTKGISGSHCEVRLENGNVLLIDLQSTYGTYFANGMKVEPRIPYQLREGDCFYLAESQQMFRLERAGEYRQKLTPAVKRILRTSGLHPKAEGVYGSWQEEKLYRAGLDGKMYFGKSPNCQVVFEESDSAVSAIHCVLYKEDSNLYLMDLGSVNGTFFEDGNRLRPDVPYLVKKGNAFYLVSKSPEHTFVIVED